MSTELCRIMLGLADSTVEFDEWTRLTKAWTILDAMDAPSRESGESGARSLAAGRQRESNANLRRMLADRTMRMLCAHMAQPSMTTQIRGATKTKRLGTTPRLGRSGGHVDLEQGRPTPSPVPHAHQIGVSQ